MKMINNIYKKFVLVVAVLGATIMTSCTDFLTIIPPDKIVDENFWQREEEVNGMLATSYLKLISTDAVEKAIVWGEIRADNLKYPPSYDNDIKYIIEANILDDNRFAKWGVYYEAINYANLVIKRAPEVVERDPDFEEGDLNIVLGEMYAMRALCHFYLVRTFRDIPMAMVPADNDADIPSYEQVHPLEALKLIMQDLDTAYPLAMASGKNMNISSNYGRITKNAILAMKADVALWQAAFATYYEGESDLVKGGDIAKYYTECIDNCRKVLDNMNKLYEDELKGKPLPEKNPYLLIENEGELKELRKSFESNAYEAIFGARNSSESIFEHQVEGDNVEQNYCYGIYSMYGTNGNVAKVAVPTSFENKYEKDDLRRYSYINVSAKDNKGYYAVAKYTAAGSNATDYRDGQTLNANWIVYRKTDIMLMLAEALASQPGAGTEEFKEAYNIVKAVNFRSRYGTDDKVVRTDIERQDVKSFSPQQKVNEALYMTREACIDLVLEERLRELAFEGKRWYDLVRKALCEKTTKNITFVADKLDSNSGVVKSKMSSIDGLFFPIHIDEIRYNKNLKQNPAYATTTSSTEMK